MPITSATGQPTAASHRDDSLHFQMRKVQRHPAYLHVRDAVRVARRLVPDAWRRATQRFRQLPSCVIVGAQKAGTTQLYAYLIRHPRCFGGYPKELQFFSKQFHRSLAWYRSRFPLAWRVARANGITIEASPSYMAQPEAIRRMHDALPDARVIVLLRDPVARAFSHYQHNKTRHREPRSFTEAIASCLGQVLHAPQRGAALRADAPPLMDYVARGYYALQIEVLFSRFPRDRVMIIDSADLFDDTNRVCQQVFQFVGLEPFDVQPGKVYNRGYYRETIDPVTAQLLRGHYRPHDELLAELVGKRFRWMDAASGRAAA